MSLCCFLLLLLQILENNTVLIDGKGFLGMQNLREEEHSIEEREREREKLALKQSATNSNHKNSINPSLMGF